jgi:HNH endonuclease
VAPKRKPLEERYWAKVDVRGPDECWPWTGVNVRGYGRIYLSEGPGGVKVRGCAHRVGWEIANGRSLAPGLVVRHRCDNPPCQNPAHLELGTHADNMRDMAIRNRAAKGERNGWSKLTEDDTRQILALLRDGQRQTDIARIFGVNSRTVNAIARGVNWKYLARDRD